MSSPADNAALQERLLDLAGTGFSILTETDRMCHQVLLRGRLRRIGSGASGWETPPVLTLNQWMERFWDELWPDRWPAPQLTRWRLLSDCIADTGLPGELDADTALIEILDEGFEHCLRYGIDPGAGEPASRLAEWRRTVWRVFGRELSARRLFHPAGLARRIVTALREGQGVVPPRIAAAGFEFAGFWEKQLLSALGARAEFVLLELPAGQTGPLAAVYPDPEQELYGLLEGLASAAADTPLHEIALVLLDSESYVPFVSKHLDDLFGAPLSGQDLAAYNLLPGPTLENQPLFAAACLSLTFFVQGELRPDLLAILRSPYYEALATWSRTLAQWDRTWRDKNTGPGLEPLFSAIPGLLSGPPPELAQNLRRLLLPFAEKKLLPCSEWLVALDALWRELGFPVLANERDEISWKGLQKLIEELGAPFGDQRMRVAEVLDLLRRGASKVRVQRSGLEEAGIQVIGRLEARGLAFEKMFIPGCVAGVLPQPVRPLPFLAPAERKRVLGGSIESQYAFADHLFSNFRAAAREIFLSRPAMNEGSEMILPSPFWPGESESKAEPVIPWKQELPALHRARWVRECILGISAGPGRAAQDGVSASTRESGPGAADPTFPDPEGFRLARVDIPSPLAVSALEAALLCPAKYYFRHVLGLDELPEPEAGLGPLERGKTLHDILALFGKKVIAARRTRSPDFEELRAMLEDTVRARLEPVLPRAVWRVEARRLIGDGRTPGLLAQWLKEEWERLQEGWSWDAAEAGFDDLPIEGCSLLLSGRLDRIDSHPELGRICWDYKTGRAPGGKAVKEDLVSPQLPAYLLALRKSEIGSRKSEIGDESAKSGDEESESDTSSDLRPPASDLRSGAGYIELGSAGKLRYSLIFEPGEDHAGLLGAWEKKVCEVLESIRAGLIPPLWLTEGALCEEGRCPYRCLCGAP